MKATIVPLQILWHAIYYFGSYPSQLGRTINSFFSLHAYIALSVTIKAIPLGGGFLARSSWILLCPVSEIHGSFIKKNLLSIPERQSREIVIINIVLIFSSMPWPTIWKGVSYTWSWGFYSLYFLYCLAEMMSLCWLTLRFYDVIKWVCLDTCFAESKYRMNIGICFLNNQTQC